MLVKQSGAEPSVRAYGVHRNMLPHHNCVVPYYTLHLTLVREKSTTLSEHLCTNGLTLSKCPWDSRERPATSQEPLLWCIVGQGGVTLKSTASSTILLFPRISNLLDIIRTETNAEPKYLPSVENRKWVRWGDGSMGREPVVWVWVSAWGQLQTSMVSSKSDREKTLNINLCPPNAHIHMCTYTAKRHVRQKN